MADTTPPAEPTTTPDSAATSDPTPQPTPTEPGSSPAAPSLQDSSSAGASGPDTSGFYRLQDQTLQFAPNEVHAPDYTLSRLDRERLPLPHDGWQWFDSAEAAHAHHGLELPKAGAQASAQQLRPGQPPLPPRKASDRPERSTPG